MQKLIISICAAMAVSCSTTRSVVDEVNEGNIQIQSVLDLARNSYLKGCVDSKNHFAPLIKKSSFETCRDLAKEHQEEIRFILEQNAISN
ncbi:MAG: hypothetical protein KC478_03140 [Bacteriovoracaceae bacterium]|nr:hypothetical protein [Bacteriovoracaceae bacterium]